MIIGALTFGAPRVTRVAQKHSEIKDIKGLLTVLTANSFKLNGTSIFLCGVGQSDTTSAERAAQSVNFSYESAYVKCRPSAAGCHAMGGRWQSSAYLP